MGRFDPLPLTVSTALAAAAATTAVIAVPALAFAYEAPSPRIAVETAAALVALLVAFLVFGRYRRRRRRGDLVLALSLALLCTSNTVGAIAIAVRPAADVRLTGVGLGVAGALLLTVAAWMRSSALPTANEALVPALAAGALGALCVIAVFGLRHAIPGTIDPLSMRHATSPHPIYGGVSLMQLLAAFAFAVAAAGFTVRAAREKDEFLTFVAIATVLGSASRLHYFLFPPLDSGWLYTGDAFRVAFYSVLVIGAGREIQRYWQGARSAAVLEERQRIARDLHDGVAQELAYIRRHAGRLAERVADDELRRIAASTDRALADSRRAIAALTRPLDDPLAVVLADALAAVADRHSVELDLDLDAGAVVSADTQEALVRIACEAVGNAATHGGAAVVRVQLEQDGDDVRLVVSDEGSGFDPSARQPGRFGLTIMEERAHGMGGAIDIASRPGGGTRIEVRSA
jgi:signal transduction histidine kinase